MSDEFSEVDKTVIAWAVRENASRHLGLYEVTGNGMLIWKAYAEYRRARLPVPETILSKLDEFGERLQSAHGADGVAAALELRIGKGGPQGATLLQGQERARDIVEAFHVARLSNSGRDASSRRKVGELARDVGEKYGITAEEVQTRYSQWKRKHSPECGSDDPVGDLMELFARKT